MSADDGVDLCGERDLVLEPLLDDDFGFVSGGSILATFAAGLGSAVGSTAAPLMVEFAVNL